MIVYKKNLLYQKRNLRHVFLLQGEYQDIKEKGSHLPVLHQLPMKHTVLVVSWGSLFHEFHG